MQGRSAAAAFSDAAYRAAELPIRYMPSLALQVRMGAVGFVQGRNVTVYVQPHPRSFKHMMH